MTGRGPVRLPRGYWGPDRTRPILDKVLTARYAVDLSVCLEKFAQFVFRSVEVEVPNKYVLHANASE